MQPHTVSPAFAAQLDWMTQGEFSPEKYDGEQRKEYEDAQRRIEQQWDHQPE